MISDNVKDVYLEYGSVLRSFEQNKTTSIVCLKKTFLVSQVNVELIILHKRLNLNFLAQYCCKPVQTRDIIQQL